MPVTPKHIDARTHELQHLQQVLSSLIQLCAPKSCSLWMLMRLQEKKKRDTGQQSRGKSTVEEEKRIARNFGVYSGFD